MEEFLLAIGITQNVGWMFIVLLVLIFVDTFTKIVSILKTSKKKKLTDIVEKTIVSNRFTGKLIIKLSKYFGLFLLGSIANTIIYLTGVSVSINVQIIPIGVLTLVCIAEMWSIWGNILSMSSPEEISMWKKIFDFLQKVFNVEITKKGGSKNE